MKKGLGNATAARIEVAARRLIEGDAADLDARRPSRTVFTENRSNDEVIEDCIFGAALDGGLSAVSIRFGRDARRGQPDVPPRERTTASTRLRALVGGRGTGAARAV